jgi:sugar/nucleoside kinase (ribokinase family)
MRIGIHSHTPIFLFWTLDSKPETKFSKLDDGLIGSIQGIDTLTINLTNDCRTGSEDTSMTDIPKPPVLCIGSALWDIIASASCEMQPGNDVAGIIRRRPGGVALNIALALVERGQPAALLTTIGNDAQGDELIAKLEAAGVDCQYVTRLDDPTDSYLAIETTSGVVFGAIADCASLEKAGDIILTPVRDGRLGSAQNPWQGSVVIDGNLPVSTLESIAGNRDFDVAHLSFVPASPGKAERMRAALQAQSATLFVNKGEAEILCKRTLTDSREACEALCQLGAHRAVVTDGPNESALCDENGVISVIPPKVEAKTTTGAGDVFLATFVGAEIASTFGLREIMETAVKAAADHVMKDTK